jgi:very-short-patch-repair endonuclease
VTLNAEVDGREFQCVRADRRRDQRLATLGYRVVRFTWRQILDGRDDVAGTLRALLTDAG